MNSPTRPLIQPRPSHANPRADNCPLHLRRICGVCRHFEGAHLRDVANCARHGVHMRGVAGAQDCPDWERKVEGAG